jgi:hypothetical protein
MNEQGYTCVFPELGEEDKKREDVSASPLSSTYVKNGISNLPKCKDGGAWRPRPNYFLDRWRAERCDLTDGLKWEKVST